MKVKNNIVLYNTKGGVGKTTLSYNIAKDLKLNYITNDMSVSIMKMPKAKLVKKNIPIQNNTIYDFGGFEDEEALKIANQASLLIIPTISDMNAMARTISLIKKIKHSRILVVSTMIENEKDYEDIKMVINHHFKNIKVFKLRRTKLFKNAMNSGIGAIELYKQNKIYTGVISEYNQILKECIENE